MMNDTATPFLPDAEQNEPPASYHIHDRRRHRRFKVERPGKVFRRSTQKYVSARSADLSFTGALLEVESERAFQIGEIIDIGLALTNKAVMPATDLIRGIVVRTTQLDAHRQSVAIRYLHREAVAKAA